MSKLACASHILVKTKPEADRVLARLANGDNFAKLAKTTSICPSAKRGVI